MAALPPINVLPLTIPFFCKEKENVSPSHSEITVLLINLLLMILQDKYRIITLFILE